MIPSILFYAIIRVVIRKIARQKRAQALKSSFVKIKGNDVVATTKIFYSLIFVPLLWFAYVICFGLTAKIQFGYSWTETAKVTFLLAYFLPIYLYVCIFYCYDFVRWGRLMLNQLRFRVFNRTEGMNNFRMLLKEKLELENEMMKLLSGFKEELAQFYDKMITKRKIGELIEEERIDEILREIR